jgi:hypothetical protein
VVRDARLEIAGRSPEPLWIDILPDRVERVLETGALTAAERLSVALDAPVVTWEVETGDTSPVAIEWTTDLRGPESSGGSAGVPWSWLEPAGKGSAGARLRIGGGGCSPELVCQVLDGEVETAVPATDAGEPCLRVRVVGEGRLRLLLVGGADHGEVERGLVMVERVGLDGLRDERIRHAERIRTHLAAVEAPSPDLERAFEWAKARLVPPVPGGPGAGVEAAAAEAALALGDRDVARDLLRSLARRGDTGSYRMLARPYAAWTGDLDYLERYQPGISATLADAAPAVPGLDDGDPEPSPAPVLPTLEAEVRLAMEEAKGALNGRQAAGLIRSVVSGLWGIRPDAMASGLVVRPRLPPKWRDLGLLRLRIGGTVLDLRLRRREETVTLRADRLSGPPLRLTAAPAGDEPLASTTVNDEPVGAGRISCQLDRGVEVRWTGRPG